MNLSNRMPNSASARNLPVPISTLRDPITPSNLVGSALSSADLSALESRWIDRPLAETALLRRVDSFTGAQLVGRKGGDYSGIAIPYFAPGARHVREYRLRRDHPEFEKDATGQLKARQKYLSPPSRGNMLYLPPGCDSSLLTSTELPLIVTEGEFKTLALSRLANWNANAPRFLPVGVSGVFNWRGTIGKTTAPDGQHLNVKGPIPDLDWIAWDRRKVIVAFDADANSKDQVRFARSELARHLRRLGASVGFYEWNVPQGKGIDDHLFAVGPEVVLSEISKVSFTGLNWREELIRAKPTTANPQGYIYPVLANAITALRHAPEWSGVLAFDEFQLAPVAVRATPWGTVPNGSAWSDQEDRLTAEWLQRNGILADVSIAAQAAQTVAKDRCFHPVRKYVESIQWDGIERLDRWLSIYLGVEDNNYTRAVGARWLISAAARIYQPGVKADCCLILEGPQGIKKSTALKTLAGPYFTDELADLGSKDSVLQTRGVWIIELSELDTLSRSEVSRIKAFMSRTTDRFRPPYGKRLVESPRQCVFAGTVNHSTYLRDDTGARRFWPVACGVIDIETLARHRDQLWAEAKVRFDAGGVWWLENADLAAAAAEEQAARFESDPWEELIAHWVENRADASVCDALSCCLDKPRAQWTQVDKNRVARCFRTLGWERYRERQGDRLQWRYRRA